MLAVNKEQAELEKKAQDIQGRIDAIKKLRESQQGPSAVLRDIKARFDGVPGLVPEESGTEGWRTHDQGYFAERGFSDRFGQSLEFSSGLFTNLNIETQRELAQATATEKRRSS